MSRHSGLHEFEEVIQRFVFTEVKDEEIDKSRGCTTESKLEEGEDGELQDEVSNRPSGKIGEEEEGDKVHELLPNRHINKAFGVHGVEEVAAESGDNAADGNGKYADGGTV